MKYESIITITVDNVRLNCVVKAIDVLAYNHTPSVMVDKITGCNWLTQEEKEAIYDSILQIIQVSEEETETLEAVATAVAKGIKVEVENSLLARWAFGICSVYINYADENGLLRGVKWEELPFWTYLAVVQLQKATVEVANSRKKMGIKG